MKKFSLMFAMIHVYDKVRSSPKLASSCKSELVRDYNEEIMKVSMFVASKLERLDFFEISSKTEI